MKVLIIKISSMGDIIHVFPAITDATYAIPNISFDWVIEKSFIDIPKWHVGVDQVISINLRHWRKSWYKYSSWKEYFQYSKLLKKKYDLIIDAQGLLKTSVFVTRITQGKKHGMNYISARESISAYFLNHSYYVNKHQHAIERMRQLFAYSLQYSIPSVVGKYSISNLFPRKVSNIPYVIFFHGTTCAKKHWVESNWNVIIKCVVNLGFFVKLPCWTQCEILRAKRLSFQKNGRVLVLLKLTLQQIAMQISQATAVISVDTGLSHLSAALHCPGLTLYGPTNPYLIGTYGMYQRILYANTKNMKDLTVLHVWRAFKKILENYG